MKVFIQEPQLTKEVRSNGSVEGGMKAVKIVEQLTYMSWQANVRLEITQTKQSWFNSSVQFDVIGPSISVLDYADRVKKYFK